MTISWFGFYHHDDPEVRLSTSERDALGALLAGCSGLSRGQIYTPAETHDPYSDDRGGPRLALELEFGDALACECHLRADGVLQALADPNLLPAMTGATVSQQGMLSRHYPVPFPSRTAGPGLTVDAGCTYLVDYPGPAADEQAWHYHYLGHHRAIMAKFPGIRAAAVYTPAVIVSALPFGWARAMQRNKVVFDSPASLTTALNSPVREEMRRDFERFPPFQGGNHHFPMLTARVEPFAAH